jgi:hypothetical protein
MESTLKHWLRAVRISKMNSRLAFRPNLIDCILEERVSPAIANIGIFVLTTSGFALVIPFPGANVSAAGSLGSSGPSGGSAASVSGVPVPTSLYITGQGGISSLKPGNITGVPSLAGALGGAGGSLGSILVGSGADDANGSTGNGTGLPAPNPVSGAFSFTGDPTPIPAITVIGGASSGSSSPVLPPGQSYRVSAPVGPATVPGVLPPQSSSMGSGSMGSDPFSPNPQMGAPTLGPFNRMGGMTSPLPGSMMPRSLGMPGSN